jgi:peptide/nickel transport system substrate-binding protein
MGLIGQPETLNPVIENDSALRELGPLLFDSLLTVDPQTASLQPGLARSWTYTPDGRQVTFELPSNLAWSDGLPLTAADLAESLRATEHPALLAFSDIEAPDDETLTLTFTAIDCAAVTTIGLLPLLRSAEITATVPIGSGPFRVENWSEDKQSLALTPNPNYRGPAPYLDDLTIRFVKSDEVAIALSEGQFDLFGPLQSPISNLQALISNPPAPFSIMTYPAAQVIYLAINFDPKNEAPVALEVRQALRPALDREAILATALNGDGQLLAGSLLPDHWAAAELSPPAYDPAAARALLAEAGLRDTDGDGWLDQAGERLELSIRLNGENWLHQDIGWLASSYYRDVGLYVRAEGVPFDSLIDDLFTHDFSLAIFSWPILPDPDQRLYWRSDENGVGIGLNFESYNSGPLDDLLDQAVATPGCDPAARAGLVADIQQTLAQDSPVDFLLAPNRHVLVGPRLRGVQPGPFAALMWNSFEWYVQDE